jgi:plexin A
MHFFMFTIFLLITGMFTIAATGVTTGTRLLINSLARDRYPISYVYGFQSRGFSYFLTIQKKSAEASRPFISKLG